MKLFFSTFLLFSASYLFSQQTITLTADLVLTETLLITEDVNYEGNGFAIRCDGCDPAIQVANGATANFNDVRFPKTFASWIRVREGANANWNSERMTGYIRISENN